jgi:kynureninase
VPARLTRAHAAELDAADPLAALRDRFVLPKEVRYLDGNSLGALPVGVAEAVAAAVSSQWGQHLIGGWNADGWWEAPRRVAARIAPLVGAVPGEVTVADSTSVNLYKLLVAGLRLQPGRKVIVTDPDNFPTDLYLINEVAATFGGAVRHARPADLVGALDASVAIVAYTEVDYRSGERTAMDAVTALAHQVGALMLWDLSHSVGAFPVDLGRADADLAVGCSYKYLNGGPGAPAWLFVNRRHLDRFHQPLVGWTGHADPFAFDPTYHPGQGIDRARTGTPAVLSLVALEAALEVFDGVDLAAVEAKGRALGDFFIELTDTRLKPYGLEVASPRDATRRGNHVSLAHPGAYPMVQALIDRGVVGDFRAPNLARFGFGPLYTRFVDVWAAVDTFVEVLASGAWQDTRYQDRAPVT